MNPYFRYLAMIGAALVLGLGIFLAGRTKPDDSKIFMGVGGDPRMRLCDSPANAELAQIDVLSQLGIGAPLVKAETDTAAYRVSVLRPLGQESVSVTFTTPKTGDNTVRVARWSQGALSEANADLDVTAAATLIFSIKEAKIWEAVKPTMETLARAGGASAVVEVQAPGVSRCITTRYDDERVRPLLGIFVDKVEPLIAPMSLQGLRAPDPSFLRNGPASQAGQSK